MLKKVMYLVALVSMLVGLVGFAAPAPLEAGGPVYWENDFTISVYGWPKQVTAGKEFTITISAGSASMGPASHEDIELSVSEGGFVAGTPKLLLNDNGVVTATLTYTMAGSAELSIVVGANMEFTHTVKAGDTLLGIAEESGDRYPEIYTRNQGVVGEDPSRLVPGQILNIVRYAPSRVLELEVLPAEPSQVEFAEPIGVIAGARPEVAGVLQDQYGNAASGTITVTLQSEAIAVNVPASGKFEIAYSTVYTESVTSTGFCPDLTVQDASGNELNKQPYCVASSEPASLQFADSFPAELEAGMGFYAFDVMATDKFNNPVSDLVVSMGTVTSTTDIAGLASFSWEVPTQTQAIELLFEASDLTIGGVVTVTPAAVSEITATVREDGSVLVFSYDEYGNTRIGDAVTVTVEVNGLKAVVEAVTANPGVEAEEAEKEAAASKAPVAGETYTVQAGDSLWKIYQALAGEKGTGMCWNQWRDATMSANGLTYNADGIVLIHSGNVLSLPSATVATP